MLLVLFDGVCNLCNSSVQLIIRHDHKAVFRFASLQSSRGQAELKRLGLDHQKFQSIIVVEGDRFFERSSAALKIAINMGGIWKLFGILYIFPRFLRDPVYDLIARNRYRLFGKKKECMIPTPELRSRFVE